MTDIVAAAPEKPRGKKGLLIPLVATLVLGGAGFASSYLGFWSPSGMLSGPEEPVQSTEHMSVEFIDIPTIEIVIPGGRARSLVLSATIETDSPLYKDFKSVMLYSGLKKKEFADEVFTQAFMARMEELRK